MALNSPWKDYNFEKCDHDSSMSVNFSFLSDDLTPRKLSRKIAEKLSDSELEAEDSLDSVYLTPSSKSSSSRSAPPDLSNDYQDARNADMDSEEFEKSNSVSVDTIEVESGESEEGEEEDCSEENSTANLDDGSVQTIEPDDDDEVQFIKIVHASTTPRAPRVLDSPLQASTPSNDKNPIPMEVEPKQLQERFEVESSDSELEGQEESTTDIEERSVPVVIIESHKPDNVDVTEEIISKPEEPLTKRDLMERTVRITCYMLIGYGMLKLTKSIFSKFCSHSDAVSMNLVLKK